MNDAISVRLQRTLRNGLTSTRIRVAGVLCSTAVLAAPAANQCQPAPQFCEVNTILQTKCQACHQSPPIMNAPMPLVTYEDTQASAASDPSQKVWERMQVRTLQSTENPMPPSSRPDLALTQVEKDQLKAWFDASTPAWTSCP
jgi:uncharacterized membrane protein